MGPTRWLNHNLISDVALLTVSEAATGRITALRKDGLGSSIVVVAGAYTGLVARDYLVEIEVSGNVGVATFKWSEDDGATFVATGVLTSELPVALSFGLTIRFSRGVSTDCEAGDVWRWRAYLPWGPARMLDADRDTEFRTAGTGPVTCTLDFTAAVTPTVLALLDHNLVAGASLRLQASADAFASVAVNDAIPVVPGSPLVHYLGAPPRTYRYWRVAVSNPGNPDGYLRWSELYLGTYLETRRRVELGDVRQWQRVVQRDRAVTGRWLVAVPVLARNLTVDWDQLLEEDRDALFAIFEGLFDAARARTEPGLLHLDSADPDMLVLVEWSPAAPSANHPGSPERYAVEARLAEVPRTL